MADTRLGKTLYPRSAKCMGQPGDALDAAGKKDEALASYRKAVSIAEASGDPNLETFKNEVARLAENPER